MNQEIIIKEIINAFEIFIITGNENEAASILRKIMNSESKSIKNKFYYIYEKCIFTLNEENRYKFWVQSTDLYEIWIDGSDRARDILGNSILEYGTDQDFKKLQDLYRKRAYNDERFHWELKRLSLQKEQGCKTNELKFF